MALPYSDLYPLHHASSLGDIQMIESLITENGHSPNETDYEKQTPLHVTCLSGHTECAKLLINFGASINAMAIDGGTPICGACAAGHVNCVKLLLKHGALVNPPHSLSTPLHEASFGGSAECVRLLVTSGARLNTMDCNFGTPLHAAVFQNRHQCIRQLLLSGANVNATKFHMTPLHMAVDMNHEESVLELLRFGANVFAYDNQEKRPIDLVKHQNGPIFEALDYAQNNPSHLKDLCRRTIIKHQTLPKIRLIYHIPKSLIEYINYINLS